MRSCAVIALAAATAHPAERPDVRLFVEAASLDDRAAVEEDALVLRGDASTRRSRLPARRAFWFGWQAQFPDTELVR